MQALAAGRGPVGKVAVVGAKDRLTKRVAARVVRSTDQQTLHGFVEDHAAPGATVYTDDATVYESLRFNHATVKHSLEYVKGDVHTNGIESLWRHAETRPQRHVHKLDRGPLPVTSRPPAAQRQRRSMHRRRMVAGHQLDGKRVALGVALGRPGGERGQARLGSVEGR